MRILHVLFSSHIAGPERYCIDLANRQAALGHEVHIAGESRSPLGSALAPAVQFHGFNPLLRGFRVRRLIDSLKPEICHGHLSAGCKALKGVSPRHATIATLHLGYKAYQHAWLDSLICVNRAQTARLEGYRGLVRTIPNWLPEPPTAISGRGLREEFGLSDDVMLVGAVGRLHASRGMDVLISAFRESAPQNAALVILGEGPQRKALQKLCAGDPRIHLPGYRSSVHECLHDLDLFVAPSREESFGLAILEAMSAGVPIIATAAEGPAEFLRDQPPVLVAPDNIPGLASALENAFAKFAHGGLPKIGYDLTLFDPAERIRNIMDFYTQTIDARQWQPGQQRRRVTLAT